MTCRIKVLSHILVAVIGLGALLGDVIAQTPPNRPRPNIGRRPPNPAERQAQNRRQRLKKEAERKARGTPPAPPQAGGGGAAPAPGAPMPSRAETREAARLVQTLERGLGLTPTRQLEGTILVKGAARRFRLVQRLAKDGRGAVLLRWERGDDLPPAVLLGLVTATGSSKWWTLNPEAGAEPVISATPPTLSGLGVPATVFLPVRPSWYAPKLRAFDKVRGRSVARFDLSSPGPLTSGGRSVEATVSKSHGGITRLDISTAEGAEWTVRYGSIAWRGVHRYYRRWTIQRQPKGETFVIDVSSLSTRSSRGAAAFTPSKLAEFLK